MKISIFLTILNRFFSKSNFSECKLQKVISRTVLKIRSSGTSHFYQKFCLVYTSIHNSILTKWDLFLCTATILKYPKPLHHLTLSTFHNCNIILIYQSLKNFPSLTRVSSTYRNNRVLPLHASSTNQTVDKKKTNHASKPTILRD